jgi:hypothetical protein
MFLKWYLWDHKMANMSFKPKTTTNALPNPWICMHLIFKQENCLSATRTWILNLVYADQHCRVKLREAEKLCNDDDRFNSSADLSVKNYLWCGNSCYDRYNARISWRYPVRNFKFHNFSGSWIMLNHDEYVRQGRNIKEKEEDRWQVNSWVESHFFGSTKNICGS